MTARRPDRLPVRPPVRPELTRLEDRSLPATITVTSLIDTPVRSDLTDGLVSLREAVESVNRGAPANADVAPQGAFGANDTIQFRPGLTGTINLVGSGYGGSLAITSSVAIEGPGAGALALTGAGGTSGLLSFRAPGGYGGAIPAGPVPVARVSGLTVTNTSGPGVGNFANLTLDSVALVGSRNLTPGYGGGLGGGVYNSPLAVAGTGVLAVLNSRIADNAAIEGGGIYNAVGSPDGYGGFLLRGSVAVDRTTISGNAGVNFGGGIFSVGDLVVTNTLFQSNSAAFGGGGLYSNGDSGGPAGGVATVTNSTFAGNRATYGGALGGAVAAFLPRTSARPNTVVNFVTASNNSAGGGAGFAAGSYGGTALALGGSISAGNTDTDPAGGNSPDLDGRVASLGFNIFGVADGGSGYVSSDRQNTDPLLGPLADNGGPTPTFALLRGSPALGNFLSPGAPATDQRGFGRPATGAADIGAFQAQRPAAVADSYSTPANTPLVVVAPGVLANDGNPDPASGSLSAVLVTPPDPAQGSLGAGGLAPDGSFTFTPAAGFAGAATFLYRAANAAPGNAVAVTITVGPPAPTSVRQFAVGAGAQLGAGPRVRTFATDGTPRLDFFAYDQAFTGGVRVATGDVNGDGFDDIVTAPGLGGGPHVKVFDGKTGALLTSFFAYEATFTNGVFVAVGDVTGDGVADIVTGTSSGGGARVRVFDGAKGFAPLSGDAGDFFTFDPGFRGGVRVAVGDVNGDGVADIVTGAGVSGGPRVQAFSVAGGTRTGLANFFAFDQSFRGGVFVAVAPGGRVVASPDAVPDSAGTLVGQLFPGLPNFDGSLANRAAVNADLVTAPEVRVFDAAGNQTASGRPFESSFLGGVRVSASVAPDGTPVVYAATGEGGGSRVRAFRIDGGSRLVAAGDLSAFEASFTGSVYVGGGLPAR